MRVSIIIFLLFACGAVLAQDAIGEARLTAFAVERYLSSGEERCSKVHSDFDEPLHSAVQQLRDNLHTDIEIGRKLGVQLAASAGKDIDQVVKTLTLPAFEAGKSQSQNTGPKDACDKLTRFARSIGQWKIDDFLRLQFDRLVINIGNAQGLPCDMVHLGVKRLSTNFLESRGEHPDAATRVVFELLMLSEVQRLARAASNCEAAQTRAAEYRTTLIGDFGLMRKTLRSLDEALADITGRKASESAISTATENAKQFLGTVNR